ncbi:deoxyribose-phosphate aldolase [Phreatobacter oligotrophus]|uniref:Deoxyribose-phosphate aldolase n=1 Tax=Phreatobacter oligotrophus TaxID=1122261 RepID=A0A2T4ZEK2_9HYPH|nr:deoxyribose-phosphate aldolase [Phreatobacter oligotrophus]PTM60321.1 deoxyribose-phosphate aldolase [Phreatobacter oligotrophus]
MPDAAFARRAIALLDLTDLSNGLDEAGVERLCARAVTPLGPVAAVCLWAGFVPQARRLLRGTPVRIATVVNFPAGEDDVMRAADEARYALLDGADEIDVVLPWRSLIAGRQEVVGALLGAVRAVVPPGKTLKTILETGELKTPALIRAAARIAIGTGADIIKTSTGKTAVSATPEAVRLMLEEIRASGRQVGLKPSGGIRTADDARAYLALADEIMGEGWARPETFRFGASGLLDALLVEGGAT